MSASISEKLYILDWIYPFLKGIKKQNCNKRSSYWYNSLIFMKTGYEVKMIET